MPKHRTVYGNSQSRGKNNHSKKNWNRRRNKGKENFINQNKYFYNQNRSNKRMENKNILTETNTISNEDTAYKYHIGIENDGYSTTSSSGKSEFDEEYFKYCPKPVPLSGTHIVTIGNNITTHEILKSGNNTESIMTTRRNFNKDDSRIVTEDGKRLPKTMAQSKGQISNAYISTSSRGITSRIPSIPQLDQSNIFKTQRNSSKIPEVSRMRTPNVLENPFSTVENSTIYNQNISETFDNNVDEMIGYLNDCFSDITETNMNYKPSKIMYPASDNNYNKIKDSRSRIKNSKALNGTNLLTQRHMYGDTYNSSSQGTVNSPFTCAPGTANVVINLEHTIENSSVIKTAHTRNNDCKGIYISPSSHVIRSDIADNYQAKSSISSNTPSIGLENGSLQNINDNRNLKGPPKDTLLVPETNVSSKGPMSNYICSSPRESISRTSDVSQKRASKILKNPSSSTENCNINDHTSSSVPSISTISVERCINDSVPLQESDERTFFEKIWAIVCCRRSTSTS